MIHKKLTPEQQHTGMRNAIRTQAFGVMGQICFRSGLLLLYLKVLDFSSPAVITCLSLPFLIAGVMTIPGAYIADLYGRKNIGYSGQTLQLTGFILLALTGFAGSQTVIYFCAVSGVALFSIGDALMGSSWFGLMKPVVPANMRGRFWARLRFCWQTLGLIFSGTCAAFLDKDSSVRVFQFIFSLVALSHFIRIFFYRRIPEEEQPVRKGGFFVTVVHILRSPGYASFCCYIFLLYLTVHGAPAIFALIEKEVIAFGDNQVVWLGNFLMTGNVLGFLFVGRIVDRFGTRVIFLICHLTFGLVMAFFLFRAHVPVNMFAYISILSLLFGAAVSSSSVAVTTEMMSLAPEENQALGTSICITLLKTGMGLSGLIGATALYLGILAEKWTFLGQELSRYDTILLISAFAVVVLTVTLGLVPSVLGKSYEGPSTQ